jgi:hypothetical protein
MNSRAHPDSARAANAKRRPGPLRRSGHGGTLLGLFIGIAVGLGLAVLGIGAPEKM